MNLSDIKEGWTNLFKSYFNKLDPTPEFREMVETRAKICQECPELKHTIVPKSIAPLRFQCKKCNCFFPAVVFASRHECPLKKW